MAKIRSLSEIAAKWKDVTPRREAYYKAGVERPKKDWAEETKAAAKGWEEGVTSAVTEKRFEKGVAKAGLEKWRKRTLVKGAEQGRWSAGVRAFADEYAKGFGPFRDVIEKVELPARYSKGDDRNYERVKAIGRALHAAKLAKYA